MALQKIVLVSVQAILMNDLTKDHPAHGGRSQAIASEPDPQSLGCSHSVLPRGRGSPGRKRSTSPALQEHSADRQHEKYLENITKHRIPGLESHWEMLELEMIDLSVISRQLFKKNIQIIHILAKSSLRGQRKRGRLTGQGEHWPRVMSPSFQGFLQKFVCDHLCNTRRLPNDLPASKFCQLLPPLPAHVTSLRTGLLQLRP